MSQQQIKNVMKKLFIFLPVSAAILFLFCTPSQAYAQCTAQSETRDIFFTPGDIVISHNLTAGYVLYEQTLSDPHGSGSGQTLNCQGDGKLYARNIPGTLLKNNIFSTNIPGIGYRFSVNGNPFPYGMVLKCNSAQCMHDFPMDTQYKLELIKTNDRNTTAGTLIAGRYAAVKTDDGKDITVLHINGTKITPATCSIQDENIQVDLGKFDVKNFTGPGTTLGEKTFNIELNCDAHMQYNVIFDGHEPSVKPSTGLVALDNTAGSAQGISIRIKYKNQPIILKNKIPFFSGPSGRTSLPFSVEYYQTSQIVTAGKANAKATFNILYD